jgi:hypothetical protein
VLGKYFFQNSELWQFPCVKGIHSFFAVRYFLMKKLIALAWGRRRHALLCCGAAALLSACGAGVSDPVNGLQSQTAAELTSTSAQPATRNVAASPYGADAALAVADAATPAAPAAPAAAPAANIEPPYDSNPQSAKNAGFSDQAETPVEAAQETAPETAPAACGAGSCQH